MLTALGLDAPTCWKNIREGRSGIKQIDGFDTSNISCKIAGTISQDPEIGFNPAKRIDPRDIKKMDLFIQYGYSAAVEAVEDSGWMPEDEESRKRTGVIFGSGIGGLRNIEHNTLVLNSGGRVSPFF